MINVPPEQIAPGDAADPRETPRESFAGSSSGTDRAGESLPPCAARAHKMCRAPARLPQGTARGGGPVRLLLGSGCELPQAQVAPATAAVQDALGIICWGEPGDGPCILGEAFSIPELPVGQVCRQRGASWGGDKVLTPICLSGWCFTAPHGAAPSSWGEGSTKTGKHPAGTRAGPACEERVQETLAVGTNSVRLRHKEVIEAFTICLTSDICFLQARQHAACRRMRYGHAGARPCLALPVWGRAGPIPTAAFDTATGRCSLCGKGKLLAHQREINMRRPALTKKRVFLWFEAPL